MKRRTLGQKMRVVAGGTYIVLALYQMLSSFYLAQSALAGDLNMAMQFSVYAMWLYSGMAIWMFAKDRELSLGARRAVVVGSGLLICYQLITYDVQFQIIMTALYRLFPSIYENSVAQLVFMLVRVLLIVLAAFFVSASKAGIDHPETVELAEGDEDAMPEAIIEETVVILTEADDDEDDA